jgi:predicted helicase
MFPAGESNTAVCFSDVGSRTDFCVLATDGLADLHFGAAVDAYQQVPRYRFNGSERIDNVTDWALEQFQAHYGAGNSNKQPITKDAIFHYVYGVLHDPAYREKYALNLKRKLPRIPFYADFWRWADSGQRLMTLHIGYETIEPWPLTRVDVPDEKSRRAGLPPKPLLRADKIAGNIMLDTETQLSGIPKTAWDYRLGNRSALEWILDQHRERKPKDPTIRERFNTYRFADYKENVIELLTRVTRVSVETMKIVAAMNARTGSR